MAKADGNSRRLWRVAAMAPAETARARSEPATMNRRPLFTRSMTGPRKGATTANGAMGRISDRPPRPRAALGEMLKNNEPASARVTSVSPADDSRCTVASRENGVGPMLAVERAGTRTGFCNGRQPVSLTASWYVLYSFAPRRPWLVAHWRPNP